MKNGTLRDTAAAGRTLVVAEIGQAHDGSIGILHSMVDAAAACGVDAVKFQVHIADAESSALEPFRVRFSPVDATRFDYWKRMELPEAEWRHLKEKCDGLGVEFLATPFSNAAVDLLERIGVGRYKVGSGDIANPLLLQRIAATGKEVILSTGLGTIEDIDRAVELFSRHSVPVAVLQCTTRYPTAADDVGLPWIGRLRERYGCPVGLSDHSGKIYAGLAAAALGAALVEVHVTFDRRMFGPDSRASLTFDELAQLMEGIRFVEAANRETVEKVVTEETEHLRRMFGKAIAVNRDMAAGETLTFSDLEGKKPADGGIAVGELEHVLGRCLNRSKRQWEFLQKEDLE
jgi:N,N'-diacetyllegionaminate synthase